VKLSSNSQFGLIVAYLLPGFIGLAGIAPFVPTVGIWLRPAGYSEASLGPPVYALLAATTIGMIVSSLRWLVVDHIHQWLGLTPPRWDDRQLQTRLDAFSYLVENHYRYYQFTANTLVALAIAYVINRAAATSTYLGPVTDLAVVLLCLALFLASRDNLSKYYARTRLLIGYLPHEDESMTNGNHHEAGKAEASKPRPNSQADTKPAAPKVVQDKEKSQPPRK
jgi:hypothetical protein